MVAVIALLAVLAVFGVSVVVISTTQQVGAALDLQGVRAYHAARGGLEWGMFHLLRGGLACADIDGRTLVYGDNLAGFRATLACRATTHEEGSASVTLFSVTATGCTESATCPRPAGPTPPPVAYVERQLRVTVGSP